MHLSLRKRVDKYDVNKWFIYVDFFRKRIELFLFWCFNFR